MISSLLIANRGEIACRIIRTCKLLSIRTIAVYSKADVDALHVRLADEAVLIGGSLPIESYLSSAAILKAAKETRAEAIHPGYGFLAENKEFAQDVLNAGLVFVGPSPAVIGQMGDKVQARLCASAAGVPCIPGVGKSLSLEEVEQFSDHQGFPLLLKAIAGGGGKGMRRVDDPKDLKNSYESTVREAQASFGDGRVYVEKYIENPRHLEVQILGDGQGKILHLGERECSVQRRHQKILEETPSPSISASLREKLLAAAIQLGQHVNYGSAGTVEFVVDETENFYFLEMNTRLQVEHIVTEEVTGVDIVEWMLRLASNEPLNLSQSDISFSGHAIEARLYAEDPKVGFLPSVGRLSVYDLPTGEGVRIDSGVEGGSEITPFYDPMISKLITKGATRKQALERLENALETFVIKGVSNNRSFLKALLKHPDFQKERISTHFVADAFGDVFTPVTIQEQRDFLLATALCLQTKETGQSSWVLQIRGEKERFIGSVREGILHLGKESDPLSFSLDWALGQALGIFTSKEMTHTFQVFPLEGHSGWQLAYDIFEVDVRMWPGHMAKFMDRIPLEKKAEKKTIVASPMPGRVLDILVQPGDLCTAGQRLAIVEAMKMENIIRASEDLSIKDVLVQPGDSVISGQALLKVA